MRTKVEEKPAATVTLATLGNGAAEELFATAMQQVLANLDDPNYPAKKRRVLTLTVTMTPLDEQRTSCETDLAVQVKLPKRHSHKTTTYSAFDERSKRYVAQEYDPRQKALFAAGNAVLPRIPDETDEPREGVS
jgi:hypothetical protein